jgi:hypothetical protein
VREEKRKETRKSRHATGWTTNREMKAGVKKMGVHHVKACSRILAWLQRRVFTMQ